MVEPLVIPFVVVVRDELADGATPRALADQDHALEAGVLDGAHEARRVGVQGRRAGGASDGGDIGRGERVAPGRPEERVAVMDEEPDARADEEPCAKDILSALARRAYRRPVTDADLEKLIGLYRLGRGERDFEGGIQRALEGMLSFPAFLFRIEQDPATAKPGDVYRIGDLELASRLSFFLWRSISRR